MGSRPFWGATLGDARRTQRLVEFAATVAAGGAGDVGGTIASVTTSAAQAKAVYRLLSQSAVTHAAVLQAHTDLVLRQTEAPGIYLLIEDTTSVAYPGLQETPGLGPIGEAYTRGFFAHSTLVLRWEAAADRYQVLGLLGQQVWARPPHRRRTRPSNGRGKESGHARQLREDRESTRWAATLEAAQGPAPQTAWIYVADRESDIYEAFQACFVNRCSWVIRAAYPRALGGPDAGLDLFTAAAAGTVQGRVPVELLSPRRTAELTVRSRVLEVQGPMRPGGRLVNMTLHVVEAREEHPPVGQAPLHWVLVTDLPVGTLAECQTVLKIYRHRPVIEEFHKALKTGLKVEQSQLSEARRLMAFTGILSVVAVFLLQTKLAARTQPEAELVEGQIDAVLILILQKLHPSKGRPTRRWLYHSIAKLGGFQGRKGDGDPGWLTLWRGWQKLMLLAAGYALARGP